jgi:hypothetical protein
MSTPGADFFLSKMLTPVVASPGQSGYFSAPSSSLDPRLFVGGTKMFRPEVRDWILSTLYDYWETRYNAPREWSTVWVAGSGISYQWAANRGNGDLDILIGVEYAEFYRLNERYVGFSEDDMADIFNVDLHTGLWPHTEATEITPTSVPTPGGADTESLFEITWYVNPGATDIRDIRPYAAYNVTTDTWTVEPPQIGSDPGSAFPKEYWDYVNDEKHLADSLVSKYNSIAATVKVQQPHSPGWHNSMSALDVVLTQAGALFNDIHLGRKNAFGPSGSGYGDFYNFRWQAHKRFGTMQALHALSQTHAEAQEKAAEALYGAPIDSAGKTLRTAALWNRGGNGR